MSTAVKLSSELVEAARAEAELYSRSMTQQIEHWARVGRAIERSGAVDPERVRAALRAELHFDELGTEERMAVLGELERAVLKPKGDRALARELAAGGETLVGAGADGELFEVP